MFFGRMHLMRIICSAAIAALCLAPPLIAQTPASSMPDSVRAYIHDAMTIFREHSVHRSEVDWDALEASVFARSANAQTTEGTWAALTRALRSVDLHSFLQPPASKMAEFMGGMFASARGTSLASPAPPARPAPPTSRIVDDHIGLIVVPAHIGANRPAYVDSLHAQLSEFDRAPVCGWIVDLRTNGGGNMWPMLAGIGPLLGAEVVGTFTGTKPGEGWNYRNGRSWFGNRTPPDAVSGWSTGPAPDLAHADAPVALLIGHQTASSGEMTLLAFLGRANLRTFGDSTAGFTSSNSLYPLRDGATLVVTSSYPRDRLGRAYALRVAPDELVPPSGDASDDAQAKAAATWLLRQPACAAYR
jgi:hypothetical protein